MDYNFRVVPCEYHRGYCPTYVDTLESAITQQQFWNEHTDFLWAIEGLTEHAEQELSDYLDECAAQALNG